MIVVISQLCQLAAYRMLSAQVLHRNRWIYIPSNYSSGLQETDNDRRSQAGIATNESIGNNRTASKMGYARHGS